MMRKTIAVELGSGQVANNYIKAFSADVALIIVGGG